MNLPSLQPRGFTLIELLITLVILALLGTLVVPVSRTLMQRSQEQELRRALSDIRHGLDEYKRAVDEGKIPTSLGNSGYPKTLGDLVLGQPDRTSPTHKKLYFLRRVPRDPMNPDMKLDAEESWGKRCYESEPDSPEEGENVYDVYSKSAKVGINGAPYSKW